MRSIQVKMPETPGVKSNGTKILSKKFSKICCSIGYWTFSEIQTGICVGMEIALSLGQNVLVKQNFHNTDAVSYITIAIIQNI